MKTYSLLASAAFITAAMIFDSCSSGDSISKTTLVPVSVTKDKWSFVDKDGDILFEDEFENMPSIAINDAFSVMEKNGKYAVYVVKGDKCDVPGKLEGFDYVGYFESDLIPATRTNERIAVYDKEGMKQFDLIPVEGEEVWRCAPCYSDGFLLYQLENGKWGYFNRKGNVSVRPVYDYATAFSDHLAVTAIKDIQGELHNYTVITKTGEPIFQLKKGQTPKPNSANQAFTNGYLIANDGDRDILYDREGKMIKFPATVVNIVETDGNNIIFTDKDGLYGAAKIDGEIIISPRYKLMMFNTGAKSISNLLGKSSGFVALTGNDKFTLIDDKGQQEESFKYDAVLPFGQFGYFVKDGEAFFLMGKDGKQKGKNEFIEVNPLQLTPFEFIWTNYSLSFESTGRELQMIQEELRKAKENAGKEDYLYNTDFEEYDESEVVIPLLEGTEEIMMEEGI